MPTKGVKKNINLVGHKFGLLTVISEGIRNIYNRRTWNCLCDCGKTKNITQHSLNASKRPTRSCGCIRLNIITIKKLKKLKD